MSLFHKRPRITCYCAVSAERAMKPPFPLPEIGELLVGEILLSACFLRSPPPEGKEFLFFEWRGQLLVDLNLIEDVIGDAIGWQQVETIPELDVAIFRPTSLSRNFSAQARQYQRLLRAGERGTVVMRRSWLQTQEEQREVFGRYADSKIGGAIALLSLSGAANPRATDEFVLRTPAALDLRVE